MPVGVPEENNMGKRDLIKRKMVNHYSTLYNMKPMVNNVNTEYVPAGMPL